MNRMTINGTPKAKGPTKSKARRNTKKRLRAWKRRQLLESQPGGA